MRWIHCGTEPGVSVRTTNRLAGPPVVFMSPIEERIRGQGPGSSPATWKVNGAAAAERRPKAANINLMGERIPESGSEIEEVGAARIALVNQVSATQEIHGYQHGLRQSLEMEPEAGTGLGIIGPILMQTIHGGVVVQIELCLKSK